MRTSLLVALMAFGLWVPAAVARQTPSTAAPSPGILKWSAADQAAWAQEKAYWQFVKVHNRQAFLKLWDERFAGWPRIERAPVHKDGLWANPIITTRKILDYKLEPLSVREYDEGVVITPYRATTHSTNENGGDEQTFTSRLTHTWIRTAHGWQVIRGMSAEESPRAGESPEKSAGQTSPEAELRAAMAERPKAFLEGDIEKVASLMADEYLQTDIWGRVQDKTAWLNEYYKPLATMTHLGLSAADLQAIGHDNAIALLPRFKALYGQVSGAHLR